MDLPPWDIYAKQQYHHKLGYPLWVPDPAPDMSEVQIGDVGWLEEGEFQQLFNSMEPTTQAQPRGAVPNDYVPLERNDVLIRGPREKVAQPVLCSQTIRRLDVSSGLSASISTGVSDLAGAGASFNFECTDDYGALLMLDPTGVSTDLLSRLHIIRYMRARFDSWLEFANGKFGLALKDEEILFVCGTVKTSRWAVAAFHGDYRKKQGTVAGNLGSFASLDFSVAISDVRLDSPYYRVGPPRSRNRMVVRGPDDRRINVDTGADVHDQTIFLHYYKMKRRLLRKGPMQAAGGTYQSPSWPDDSDEGAACIVGTEEDGSPVEVERVPERRKAYDPVDALLDYILEHTEATSAVASDLDLFAIFADHDFPRDVPNALLEAKPDIFVDRTTGVGSVVLNNEIQIESEPGASPLQSSVHSPTPQLEVRFKHSSYKKSTSSPNSSKLRPQGVSSPHQPSPRRAIHALASPQPTLTGPLRSILKNSTFGPLVAPSPTFSSRPTSSRPTNEIMLHWQLCPYPSYQATRQLRVQFDVSKPVDLISICDFAQHPPAKLSNQDAKTYLDRNACQEPGFREMTIQCENLVQWPVIVTCRESNVLRVRDVFEALYLNLHSPVNRQERALHIRKDDLKKCFDAYKARYKASTSESERKAGMLRVDLLMGNTAFLGLTKPQDKDYWVANFGPLSSAQVSLTLPRKADEGYGIASFRTLSLPPPASTSSHPVGSEDSDTLFYGSSSSDWWSSKLTDEADIEDS